jgi:Outer membrane protein beta-barrel domain
MHENNFEKQVREKMDQLGFDPSDAVWAGVDKELNREKKRRRPLFWLFLFSGLVLAGGAYYFSSIKNASKQPELISQPLNPELKKDKKTATIAEHGNATERNAKAGNNNLPGSRKEILNQRRSKTETSRTGTSRKSDQKLKTAKQFDRNSTVGKNNNSEIGKNEVSGAVPIASNTEEKQTEAPAQKDSSAIVEKDSGALTDSLANKKAAVVGENKTPSKDSAAAGDLAKKKEEKKKSSPWTFGVTGGAGFSNANQDLFKPLYSTPPVSYAAANPNYAPPPTGSPNYTPSAVEAGFSFSLGGFVNRSFSKTVSVSAGLGYHYYSTKTHTGNYVASPTYFYPSSGALDLTNAYYVNGKDHAYTNQYHFIEMPVTLELKLNKSTRMPIIWEAGLSLSYLLSSDALAYDPVSNIYYKSSRYMNKLQFNGITAVMIGLPVGKSSLQVGPQLQYGFTGLLKSSYGSPGHLIFYGLKISFIPGKK